MLIITGYIHVDPADLAKFMTELNALASTTRKRPGSITYDAAVDDPQSGRLLISERWVGQAALSAHLQAADTIAFVSRWSGKMRGELRKYDASNERDVMDC
ncbi:MULTISPECIES: putative quinol monooxygenase [Agrobacterium]|jgi:quinol monooxygenase YgiN|uniref:putative quinol monooxygenase n=1 Tax=Agrobacterium TaxID=357 RepID=UPI002300C30D|nr:MULTISPECIES: putative quinol monooxygenase [Agrobacterium]MDA5641375.1 putative quinol monooxygenase [Agrobacterium sp. ST15.13.013]MDA7001569.1 putative quinol monooxygenase [Agrobacterium salinitolerans]